MSSSSLVDNSAPPASSTRLARKKQQASDSLENNKSEESDSLNNTRDMSRASSSTSDEDSFANELQSKTLKFASELDRFEGLSVINQFNIRVNIYMNKMYSTKFFYLR